MSTEVILQQLQDVPGGPKAEVIVDVNRRSQVRLDGLLVPKYANDTTSTSLGLVSPSGGAFKLSLINRIRGSMAKPIDPFNAAPWVASAAWVLSTVYTQPGQIVQNGGSLYVLQSTGTSAAAGGPTGQSAALIADGGCNWYYVGPVIPPVAIPNAPILTYAAPSGLTKSVPYNTANAFFYSGGTPTVLSGGYVFPSANNAPSAGNAFGTYGAFDPTISFISDAPKICIGGTIAYYNNTAMQVEVDGQFVTPGALVPAATVNPGGLVIDWSGVRKVRKYRIHFAVNQRFTGVFVDSASTVAQYIAPNRFRIVANGDSLTGGANGQPYLGNSWLHRFGALVGCDDLYSCAVGGTGVIANNSNSSTTYAQRIPDVVGFAPDVHIVSGVINDNGATSAARQAALLTYLQTFRASSSATIMFFGSISGSLGAAALAVMEADIAAAITTFGDKQTVFMPISTDSPPWIDGTGNVGAPTGTGNADVYIQQGGNAPHPTQAGINYMATKYANAWKSYWQQSAL